MAQWIVVGYFGEKHGKKKSNHKMFALLEVGVCVERKTIKSDKLEKNKET